MSEARSATLRPDYLWPAWVFFFAALAVRLHWNLEVHPLGDFIYSDMRGYMDRADEIFRDGWAPREYSAFYPYGTHVLVYAVQRVFGRGDTIGLAIVNAVLGAAIAGYAFVMARYVSTSRFVALATGTLLVMYYPLISLGGYVLSEVPFSLCMTAATVHLLRLMRHGGRFDAVVTGLFVAAGFTLRPQILLGVAIVGVMWFILRRTSMRRVTWKFWGWASAPLIIVMILSSVRLHHHTGRFGLIAENGTFNQVFGRCHNKKITAHPDLPSRRKTSFGPPPMIQLANRAKTAPGEWPQLEPALQRSAAASGSTIDPLHFEYRGYIGDKAIHREYMRRCLQATGWAKQVEYSFVHMLLLWRHNVMWPDSGKMPWRIHAHAWGLFLGKLPFEGVAGTLPDAHADASRRARVWMARLDGLTPGLVLPTIFAMLAALWIRRRPELAVVAAHAWSVHIIAVLYLGGMRFRAPYDPFIILLAAQTYGWILEFIRNRRSVAILARDGPPGYREPPQEAGVRGYGAD